MSSEYDNKSDGSAPSRQVRGTIDRSEENFSPVIITERPAFNAEPTLPLKISPSIAVLESVQRAERVIASKLQSQSTSSRAIPADKGEVELVRAENQRLRATLVSAMQREGIIIALAQNRERELLMEINRLRTQLWVDQCSQIHQESITESYSSYPFESSALPSVVKIKTEPTAKSESTVQGIAIKEEPLTPRTKVGRNQRSSLQSRKRSRKPIESSFKLSKKKKKEPDGNQEQKIFPCALCPAVFTLKCRLSRHIWKHTDKKPYILTARYHIPGS